MRFLIRKNSILVTNGIRLGINSRDLTYKSDTDKKYFAFAQQGSLWLYETGTKKLTQVFSFLQNGKLDARDIYDENNIRIINIDSSGNMTFLLCGYMNRGKHEGECGVAVYTYDAATTSITERLYVETQEAFSLLDKDVENLSYMSADRTHFYLTLEGSFYDINITDNSVTEQFSNLSSGCYVGSSTGGKFAWLQENVEEVKQAKRDNDLCLGTIDTWLLFKLTKGEVYATDYSNASRTMLFNINTLQWDQEILNELDIPKSMLPKPMPSSCIYGKADPAVLGGAIPIAGAAGDQQAALFGQTCFNAGEAKNTYGTGCFLLMNTGEKPAFQRTDWLLRLRGDWTER